MSSEDMEKFDNETLVWWIRCPNCEYASHIADIGYDAVTFGQRVFWTCDNCLAKIEKIVGQDTGRIILQRPPHTINPFAGVVKYCFMCGRALALDAFWCDRCGRSQNYP